MGAQWNDVGNIEIHVTNTGRTDCDIFANGMNRISVTLNIRPTNSSTNDVVPVDPKHLADNTYLIRYADGKDLGRDGSSGWCYSETANKFSAIPNKGAHQDVTNDDQTVTFYVYCCPDADSDANIGVRVHPDAGADVFSSQTGKFNNSVVFHALLAPDPYKMKDVDWTSEDTDIWGIPDNYNVDQKFWAKGRNYFLSCNRPGFEFITFDVDSYETDDRANFGLYAWELVHQSSENSRYFQIYEALVWADEPHEKVVRQAAYCFDLSSSFDNGPRVTVYDQTEVENRRRLCCTWVYAGMDAYPDDYPGHYYFPINAIEWR